MTTADVSAILAALSELTSRVNSAMEKLARIEERTSILNDHEVRIRAAEEASRVAGEVAVQAKAVADAQAVRIRSLEDLSSGMGKFTLGIVGRFLVGAGGLTLVVVSVASLVRGW